MLDFRSGHIHQVEGNRLRFQFTGKLEEDLGWQVSLRWRDRLCYALFGGWLNLFYGYSPRVPWSLRSPLFGEVA